MWLAVAAVVIGAGAGWLTETWRGATASGGPGRVARNDAMAAAGGPAGDWSAAAGGPAGDWSAAAVGAAGLILLGLGSRWIPGRAGLAVEASGYLLAAVFAMLNWYRLGMILVAAGLVANLLVIGLDGGMPVAALPAGQSVSAHHHGLEPSDRLTFLADDVTTPLVSERLSAGDLLVGLGGAVVAFSWMSPAAGRYGHRSRGPVAGRR